MAKKLYKCHHCKVVDIDKDIMKEGEDYINHHPYYYHATCWREREYLKKHPDIHQKLDDDFWKDATFEYLQKTLKVNVSNGLFYKQWYQYLGDKKNNYNAKGIFYALIYFYDIKKGDPDKGHGGIGIVPFVYEDSRHYWHEREHRQKGIVKQIEQQIREKMARESVVVKHQEIKPKKFVVNFDVLDELEDNDEL